MSLTTKVDVVGAAAVKWFRRLIDTYKGPEKGLRTHLLHELNKRDLRADEILANLIDEIV